MVDSSQNSRPGWVRATLWCAPAWPALTLLLAAQRYAASVLAENAEPFLDAIIWYAFQWGPWGLLSPLMFYGVFKIPLQSGRIWTKALALAAVGVVLVGFHTALQALIKIKLYELPSFGEAYVYLWFAKAHVEFLIFLAMAALILGYRLWGLAQAARLREKSLEALHTNRQLEAVRRQLAPHFLFNALNSLCALLPEDAPAHRMTVAIADFLRRALQAQHRDLVPLREELDLLDAYLEIERMRFGDRLDVSLEADPNTLECAVPTMILQPLVENAITHGVARCMGPTIIVVKLRHTQDRLQIEINNSSVGSFDYESSEGTGTGLKLIRQTLKTRYDDRASIDISETDSRFTVKIELPTERAHG